MQTKINATAFCRIRFTALARVLQIPPRELRGIVGSHTFPAHAGRQDGERTWRVSDVANWLDANGWHKDAATARAWDCDDDETHLPSGVKFRSRRARVRRGTIQRE